MTFAQYWAILIKQWKLIVICFVVVGSGSYAMSKLMTPLYQSSVLVEVAIRTVNNQADYNSLLASDQLVQTESQLATSDPVLREVASHNPGLSPDQLLKQMTSSPRPNTQLFDINVLDPNRDRAAALANDIAATLIKQQLQLTQQDNNRAQQQLQQDINSTLRQIDVLTARIASLQAQKGTLAQIAPLQAQLNGLQLHNTQWQTALAQLELTQAQNADFLRVVQPAQPGIRPVQPNTLLNTGVGLLAGLLLGMLLAIAFVQLDTRIRNADALGELLEWPVLATIWRAASSKKEDILNPTGQNANSEAYRILRTNIGFSSIDKPLRFVLVTSAAPHEGKSTVSANLAIFIAKAGRNVLLIDADLHRPVQHTLFGLAADKMGLSNAILAFGRGPVSAPIAAGDPTSQPSNVSKANGTLLEPFIHKVGIPHLWVMPSGPLPPSPSELLDSKSMQRLLTELTHSDIDTVIFDAPPVVGLSDTIILGSRVDGVIVVIDSSSTKKGSVKQLKTALIQSGIRVLGCVLNKQRLSRSDNVYSYYRAEVRRPRGKGNSSKSIEAGQANANGNHSEKNEDGRSAPLTPLPSPSDPVKPVEVEEKKQAN